MVYWRWFSWLRVYLGVGRGTTRLPIRVDATQIPNRLFGPFACKQALYSTNLPVAASGTRAEQVLYRPTYPPNAPHESCNFSDLWFIINVCDHAYLPYNKCAKQ